MRASFVCLRKVSKVGSACSGKWSLRVRIVVVSRKNYDKNSPGYIAHGSSYQNTVFSTQISLGLLILYSLRRKNGSIHRVLDQRIVLRATEFHNFLIYRIIRDNVFCAFTACLRPNDYSLRPGSMEMGVRC